MDFQDVSNWQNNKLNRKDSSRMGWSDISISLSGPVVEDLQAHFVERWNFIYNEKYDVRKDVRYSRLSFTQNAAGTTSHQLPFAPQPGSESHETYRPQPGPSGSQGTQSYGLYQEQGQYRPPPSQPQLANQGQVTHQQAYGQSQQGYGDYPPPPPRSQYADTYQPQGPTHSQYGQTQQTYGSQQSYIPQPYFPPPPESDRGLDAAPNPQTGEPVADHFPSERSPHHHHHRQQLEGEAQSLGEAMRGRFEEGKQHLAGNEHHGRMQGRLQQSGITGQIVRSCTKWSHGVPTEHSIANAYISVIENAQHFVYIEIQFFITATSNAQKPVRNKIGAAIVERILRAARAGEKFKIIVVIPAIPGFAGDLKDDGSLGTRAIMEFQYNSINRGGNSIMESITREGYDPKDYISFYNLRNYDRINVSGSMRDVEQRSGVDYEDARKQYDEAIELPAEAVGQQYPNRANYQQYQQATTSMTRQQGLYTGDWDSVSDCYMLGGRDIRDAPWKAGDYPEIKAFVSEELYIHSKVTGIKLELSLVTDT